LDKGVDNIWAYEECISEIFAIELMNIKNTVVYCDLTKPRAGIVAMNINGKDSSEVCGELNKHGICVRCGTHCAPLAHESLGTSQQGIVRFSFGYHNTLAEIYKALDIIETLVHN
jgi:selenocysteine lyase/cysteine desulfurase